MKIRVLAASAELAAMVAERIEAPGASDAVAGDQVKGEAAGVSAFVLRHAPAVEPARVLQRLWPLAPPTRAEPLDDVDIELLLGDSRPLTSWNLVLVTDSDDLTATLSAALVQAGFQRPRASVRPVESDAITCGDASPLVPSLITWLLARHGVNVATSQQRGGSSKRITIEARDPRLQGAALLRNGAVEIRADTLASGRAFASRCEAEGFQQVRLRRRDPLTEPGGLWSPGVLGRDPAIRGRLAGLVASVAPAMACIESDPDAPALVQLPAGERDRGAARAVQDHAALRSRTQPIPDALDELSRRIARDAGRLRLQLRTTSEAHRAALGPALADTPFGGFEIVHSLEPASTIAYGGAPERVVDALVRVVASHTGVLCTRHKAWDDDIDSVWIHLAGAPPAPIASPAPAARDVAPLFGEREGETVRIADLRVPARARGDAPPGAEVHLEGPLAEALYAAAGAVRQGTPFLLRGHRDSGRRVVIDALAHHTGHRVIEGSDAGALAAAQGRGDWLLVLDPPAEPPAWLAHALAHPVHTSGFRLLGLADAAWPGRWPAEHTMRAPAAQDVHDLLVAWVWGIPPLATLAGQRYRTGVPGHAPRPALAAAANAPALIAGLAALHAALQTEPLRFGRRRLAALVDALRDGAPGAIQDALVRLVIDRFEAAERPRVRGLALAAGIGVAA